MSFDSKQTAEAYAQEHGIGVDVSDPKRRKQNIRPGGYGENFATSRRGVWTH
jgi:NADH dehydrogenase